MRLTYRSRRILKAGPPVSLVGRSLRQCDIIVRPLSHDSILAPTTMLPGGLRVSIRRNVGRLGQERQLRNEERQQPYAMPGEIVHAVSLAKMHSYSFELHLDPNHEDLCNGLQFNCPCCVSSNRWRSKKLAYSSQRSGSRFFRKWRRTSDACSSHFLL